MIRKRQRNAILPSIITDTFSGNDDTKMLCSEGTRKEISDVASFIAVYLALGLSQRFNKYGIAIVINDAGMILLSFLNLKGYVIIVNNVIVPVRRPIKCG